MVSYTLTQLLEAKKISKRIGISRCLPSASRIFSRPMFVEFSAGFCASISATSERASLSAWAGGSGGGRGSALGWAQLEKHQAPSIKHQGNFKFQIPNSKKNPNRERGWGNRLGLSTLGLGV